MRENLDGTLPSPRVGDEVRNNLPKRTSPLESESPAPRKTIREIWADLVGIYDDA